MSAEKRASVVILGGGVAGLAAAYYLARAGHPVSVVERNAALGGLCGSFERDGFTLDHGPHKLYSVVPGILDEIKRILGDALIEHKKKNRIRLLGRYMEYPLQLKNLLPLLGPARAAKLGLDYAAAMAGGLVRGGEAASYEDYILRRFGRGVYELVFEPLARKVWGDPKLLSADLARARIPSGGATELILRLLKLKQDTQDVDAPFFYYPRGGFGVWPEKLAQGVRDAGGRIFTKTTPVAVEKQDGRVTAVSVESDGRASRLPCDLLISSIPIQALAGLLFPGDAEIAREARSLVLRDLILVFLVLDHDRLIDDHWIFFPEARYPFNRLFEQKAMSEELGPKGKTAVCCDLTCDEGDATWRTPDDALVLRCRDALVEAGLTTPERLLSGFTRRFKSFYPMYTIGYQDRLKTAYGRLRQTGNLVLTGRLGMFNYNNSDHCLDMGRFIASELERGRSAEEVWSGLEERVRTYRIID